MLDDGGAQVAFRVALPDPLVDRAGQRAADDVHVLPELDEDDGGAGVLAERQHLSLGDVDVLQDLDQHLLAQRRFLAVLRPLQPGDDIVGQEVRGRLAELGYLLGDPVDVDDAHRCRGVSGHGGLPFVNEPLGSRVARLFSSVYRAAAVALTPSPLPVGEGRPQVGASDCSPWATRWSPLLVGLSARPGTRGGCSPHPRPLSQWERGDQEISQPSRWVGVRA